MRKSTMFRLSQVDVIELYNSGKSLLEISRIVNVSDCVISTYLKDNSVKIRPSRKRESLRIQPPVGKKFGLWTVISDEIRTGSKSEDRDLYWRVRCECGEIAWRNNYLLRTGGTTRCKSCGNKMGYSRSGELQINSIIFSIFKCIEWDAKLRKRVSRLPFTMTPEYLYSLYLESPRCSLTGMDLTISGTDNFNSHKLSVDRIDSTKGYEIGNIQLVYKHINMMKGVLSQDDFINLCKMVAKHKE